MAPPKRWWAVLMSMFMVILYRGVTQCHSVYYSVQLRGIFFTTKEHEVQHKAHYEFRIASCLFVISFGSFVVIFFTTVSLGVYHGVTQCHSVYHSVILRGILLLKP